MGHCNDRLSEIQKMHFHPSLTETVSLSRQPRHLLRGEPDYCHQALRGKVFV